MGKPIRISVITAVRNGMPFVEQTIQSVIGQTYQNLEYVVIDGGSTDGTVDIIRTHAAGIAKWVSEKDEGIADAFNKGLSHASGDYILFLNADDELSGPDVLNEMAKSIVESDFPSLIYGDCDVLERSTGEILYRASIEFSPERLRSGQMLPHPSLFASRSYFDKYGTFDTDFRVAMDYEWLLRGAEKVRVVHVPELVSNVRTGGVSTQDQRRAVNEIISALRKNRYIVSGWEEARMRGYFFLRALARAALTRLGLYKAFASFRNKQAVIVQEDLASRK